MTLYLGIVLAIWIVGLGQIALNVLHIPVLEPDEELPFEDLPLVSVIVPARNEEASIGRALASLGRQSYPKLEILCVNDGSDDATGTIAAKIAALYPTVQVIEGKGLREGWLGKPNAMRQGLEKASGEILLFTDADIVHKERSVEAAVAMMEKRGLDLISALPRVEAGDLFEDMCFGSALGLLCCVPIWLVNMPIIRRNGSAAGAFIMLRRRALEEAGGLEAIRRAFIDDIALARNVKKAGFRCMLCRGMKIMEVRPFDDGAAMIRGTEKNVFAIYRNSIVLAFLFMVLPTVATVMLPFLFWPFLAWELWTAGTGELPFLLCSAIVAIQLFLRSIPILSQKGFRWPLLFTHPIAAGLWIFLVLKAAFKTKFHKRTTWRGRDYVPGDPMG